MPQLICLFDLIQMKKKKWFKSQQFFDCIVINSKKSSLQQRTTLDTNKNKRCLWTLSFCRSGCLLVKTDKRKSRRRRSRSSALSIDLRTMGLLHVQALHSISSIAVSQGRVHFLCSILDLFLFIRGSRFVSDWIPLILLNWNDLQLVLQTTHTYTVWVSYIQRTQIFLFFIHEYPEL